MKRPFLLVASQVSMVEGTALLLCDESDRTCHALFVFIPRRVSLLLPYAPIYIY